MTSPEGLFHVFELLQDLGIVLGDLIQLQLVGIVQTRNAYQMGLRGLRLLLLLLVLRKMDRSPSRLCK